MAITKIRGNTQIKTGSITNVEIAANAGIELSKLAEGAELIKRDGSVAFTGNIDAGSNKVVNVSTPTASGDAANKAYVDAEVAAVADQVVNDLDPRLDAIEGRMTTAEGDIDALEVRMSTADETLTLLSLVSLLRLLVQLALRLDWLLTSLMKRLVLWLLKLLSKLKLMLKKLQELRLM